MFRRFWLGKLFLFDWRVILSLIIMTELINNSVLGDDQIIPRFLRFLLYNFLVALEYLNFFIIFLLLLHISRSFPCRIPLNIFFFTFQPGKINSDFTSPHISISKFMLSLLCSCFWFESNKGKTSGLSLFIFTNFNVSNFINGTEMGMHLFLGENLGYIFDNYPAHTFNSE